MCVQGWGHLTQWYLGGSSLVVVRKMMMARTEPTSMTSPQTGKMPWIWYNPSARSGERTRQCGPTGWAGSHQAGGVGLSLVPKATSTPPCWGRPHGGRSMELPGLGLCGQLGRVPSSGDTGGSLGSPWALTGTRLEGEDAEQGAGDDVQAVEGSLPVQVVLVRVHHGHGEQQHQLHRDLGGIPRV